MSNPRETLTAMREVHNRVVAGVHEGHGTEYMCTYCETHWPCQGVTLNAALQAVLDVLDEADSLYEEWTDPVRAAITDHLGDTQ